MYAFIHDLLADKKGGDIFKLFSGWHFFYILVTVCIIAAVYLAAKDREEEAKRKTCTFFIDLSFALYMLDFFLMPFAYEAIDIEKLPFHICTAMCLACFISRHHPKLYGWHTHFALLGFLSNLVYLIYPAGVMWHAVHPSSYRVIQTLIFHSLMTVYGFLTLALEKDALSWKTCWKDLVVLAGMTVWALLGNTLYRGSAGSYSNDFNWFFVERDPFNMFDPKTAPYIMPFLNIAVFFAAEMLIYCVYMLLKKKQAETD
ncbi:MAG: YwaF family protein [Lachnospiraceae bacterium]|nr:YwaF family protein [Lachnospiraceae bacterium]